MKLRLEITCPKYLKTYDQTHDEISLEIKEKNNEVTINEPTK